MTFLIFIAIAVAVPFVGGFVGQRRSQGRAAALERGETVRLPVRVRGDRSPYASRYERGRLEISLDRVLWHPRGGDRLDLVERGVRPGRVDELDDTSWRNGIFEASNLFFYATVHCRDDSGADVVIRAHDADVDTVVRTLRARLKGEATKRRRHPEPSEPPREPRASRLPYVLIALAALVMAAPAYLVLTGETVTATVTQVLPDDSVEIAFTGPWDGATHTTSVDSYDDEQVGDTVEVLATRWPLTNDAGFAWELWAFGAIFAVPLLLVGVYKLLSDLTRPRRRRRKTEPEPLARAPLDHEALDDVPRHADATFDGVRAYLQTRAEAEEWPTLEPAAQAPSSALAALGRRGLLKLTFWTLFVPVVVAGFALSLAIPATVDAIALQRSTTAVTTGEVTGSDSYVPLMTTAFLTITVDGDTHDVDAPVTRGVNEGDVVEVRYAVDDPTRAVVIDHDGTARDFAVGWLVVLAALVFAAWRVRTKLLPYKALPPLLDEPARPMRYALTRDPNDEDFMLLFDTLTDAPPRFALGLLPGVMTYVGLSGYCQVHGNVVDGGRVVPVVDGAPVWPTSDLFAIDSDELGVLLDPLLDLVDDEV